MNVAASERSIATRDRIERGATEREDGARGAKHPRMAFAAVARKCPRVLVMDATAHFATSPPNDLRGHDALGETNAACLECARGAELVAEFERRNDSQLHDLAGVARSLGTSERFACEEISEIAVEWRETATRRRARDVRATCGGRARERRASIDLLALGERPIKRHVTFEAGAVREEELEWDVFARRSVRLGQK